MLLTTTKMRLMIRTVHSSALFRNVGFWNKKNYDCKRTKEARKQNRKLLRTDDNSMFMCPPARISTKKLNNKTSTPAKVSRAESQSADVFNNATM